MRSELWKASWKVNLAGLSTKNGITWWQCGMIKRLGRNIENERKEHRMLRGCIFPAIYYIFPLRKRDERLSTLKSRMLGGYSPHIYVHISTKWAERKFDQYGFGFRVKTVKRYHQTFVHLWQDTHFSLGYQNRDWTDF